MSVEEWRPVLGWEDSYEVSSHGRVRSLDREIEHAGRVQIRRSQVLRPRRHRQGYLVVALHARRIRRDVLVHILVAEAFHGPRPEGLVVCHSNDIKADNRRENLRWDTPSENQRDRVRNGNDPNSNKTHCKHGHEFTPENTHVLHGRERRCRTCSRLRARQIRARAAA